MSKINFFPRSCVVSGVVMALLASFGPGACSPHGNISGATNWLRCSNDADCSDYATAVCAADGYCVDEEGERVPASGGASASGGAAATGGRDGAGGSSDEASGGSSSSSGGMGGDAGDVPCELRGPDDCGPTPDCLPVPGRLINTETCEQDAEFEDVGCLPADTLCSAITKTAVSPDGECYWFGMCYPTTFRSPEPGECTCSTSSVPLSELNQACDADDSCPVGLTPVFYYGVAGTSGPQFCSCSIPCADDPNDCPEDTACITISDGPGEVCAAN